MGLRDLIFGRRDTLTNPVTMVGFPSDGGLTSGGVSATTTLGLSAVWRCIDILSNGVSQLPWRERMANLDVPPSRLVTRPQAQRTRREWTSLVVSTLALFDVCYLWKAGGLDEEGVPLGLWYLDPTLVMPASEDMFTTAFLLPPQEFFVGQQRVSRDNLVVLHRSPQPTISDTAGGIINLARATFAAAIAAERYASRYWQAGGSPTTVLETEQRLTQTQIDETSEKWAEKRARGPDYAPVLAGGVKARSFGADPTSESAVEARRELVADIGRYFGIPTRILNAPTGDSETYTSTPAANGDLVRYTLQNYIGAIEDGISDVLPEPRYMEMDVWKLTAGTQYEQAQAYQLATGNKPWMTSGEVRERIGLPPIENPADLAPPAPAPSGPPAEAVASRSVTSNGYDGYRAQAVGFQPPVTVLERTQLRRKNGQFGGSDGSGGSTGSGGGGSGSEGSSGGGGTGYLDADSPEVKAAAASVHAKAVATEPAITRDIDAITTAAGGVPEGRAFAVKSEGSLARKIATDPDYVAAGKTVPERAASVKDSVRYTAIIPPDKYAAGVQSGLASAEAHGYKVSTKNAWTRESGYAGYHATLSKSGQPDVELQFHTRASFNAKEIGDPAKGIPASHVIYEKLRVSRDANERAALEGQVAALWAPVRGGMPAGVLSLP